MEMETFSLIFGMLIILVGIFFIFGFKNKEKEVYLFFKICGFVLIFSGTLTMSSRKNINNGAERFYKNPEKFKIEIKYELKDSILVPVDTIVKEK